MATPQLADHLRTLDLIQEEADHQPRFFKANYELHTPRLLATAQALRAELATAREELAPYEPFNPQQCAKGLHADWLADSEYTHSCPWCLIAEQQEGSAARTGCPDPIECDHEAALGHAREEVGQWKRRALRAEGAVRHALWMSPLAYNNETAAQMTERFRLHIEATYPDLIVRYSHQPVEVFKYADGCECTDYESADYENDHSQEAEDGYVCSRSLLGRVCESCKDEEGDGPEWARDSILWPCPPIAELNKLTDAGVLAAAMSRPSA